MSSSGASICPECGGQDIEMDAARGHAVCVECGTVLENAVIVAEVGFQEDARGRASAIGQHVNADGRPNRYGGPLASFSREATQHTMDKGRRKIRELSSTLKMKSSTVESASRLFRIAVERNFHKGRRMANVCCACLYVVCRRDKTPHMLIDFADVLETNVYVLGHTFLKFVQLLSLGLPIIDPSLYIHRFASNLEFGDKTHAVAMSALRLLARMRRDWMTYGRRPAGLCGAALIIASRMHNFYRSQSEVVRVVRIGNVALRERLQELDRTPTAGLTTAQIEAGGGDDGKIESLTEYVDAATCNPPAYMRGLKRRAQAQQRVSVTGASAKAAAPESSSGDPAESASVAATSKSVGLIGESANTEGSAVTRQSASQGKESQVEAPSTVRTVEDDELENEMKQALESEELQQLEMESMEEEQQSLLSKKNSVENDATPKQRVAVREEVSDVEVDGDLSDLDDDDVEEYLNTEEEYENKKRIWQELNKEYLEQQANMERLKKENPEEYRKLKPSRRKKKKVDHTGRDSGDPVQLGDAKSEDSKNDPPAKPSSKLNYAALESLGGPGSMSMSVLTPSTAPP